AATTFGVGMRGTGMRGWMGWEHLSLQADLAGGFLYFDTPLLAANASRFNFTGAASVALRVAAGEGGHLVLGYRILHLSNGGLGEVNPGMDAYQIHLGAWVR
ncbi:MAG TPA: acyloxyacyl hydrolase, partial [Longimicrobiales bacterium]|nr:acyloxyacyl hydrolase [Longimicrobiales bacterium]